MHRIDHFRGLMAYESWATEQAIASIESVPESARGSASFDRALRLIPHVQLARAVWLHRLKGERYDNPKDWFPRMDPSDMRTLSAQVDDRWRGFLAPLSEQDLDRECTYTSSEGAGYASRVGDVLAHVFNHSTYHRGQVARLVAESGGQRAATDQIILTRRRLDHRP
ncbi:MAG: hypothetical protein DYG92_02535 [Leptolyngbya sp. PLA1]|nr:hypothetical protein [Leptolyngbya sp. PLA1]